jgi:hypothetical protein
VEQVTVQLSCKQCRFSVPCQSDVIGQWEGECRGACPVPMGIPSIDPVKRVPVLQIRSLFPHVGAGDWCYKHEVNLKGVA